MADSQADAGASGTMTAAQELLAEHARTGSHAATVEDTVDDEDLAHPRPPSTAVLHGPASPDAGSRPLSEKAAGKQKAQVPSDAPTRPGPKPAFNPDSEEMFPALAPPKQLSAQASPAAWGKKASAAGDGLHGPVNGIAGSGKPGSRSPTSASAGLPPAHSLTASQTSRQPAGSGIALPGRHTERIKFAPSQLLPRQQLKRHVHEILRDINKRSKAKIDMKAGPGGLVIFEGQGPVDAVRQALKEVANQVGSKVCSHHAHCIRGIQLTQ